MALGITKAVIFFSRLVISYIGIESCWGSTLAICVELSGVGREGIRIRRGKENIFERSLRQKKKKEDTDVCDPSEYISVEANMILRDIKSSLNQNFSLQRAAII